MMKASRNNQNPQSGQPQLAGWDISLAALALACMTAGFWRLWPGGNFLDAPPIGALIMKAGLASLGFVAIASRFEAAWAGLWRNPMAFILIGLAGVSALWAITPAVSLQQTILLIVVWSFGIGLALRFKLIELAEICGFAGVFGLVMHVAAQNNVPDLALFDGDLAFAFIASLWAAMAIPARRMLWLMSAGLCAALAFAGGDNGVLGAGLGFAFGLGLARYGSLLGRADDVPILVHAWIIAAVLAATTLLAMFGAGPIGSALSQFLTGLGPDMLMGQGFGVAGGSIANSFGMGLGLVGLGVLALIVAATICQLLFGNPVNTSEISMLGGVCLACVGAILAAPGEVATLGPICAMFAGTSFAISLACVRQPTDVRQSVGERRAPVQDRSPKLTTNGLRARL